MAASGHRGRRRAGSSGRWCVVRREGAGTESGCPVRAGRRGRADGDGRGGSGSCSGHSPLRRAGK
jgi:hypothetical protein